MPNLKLFKVLSFLIIQVQPETFKKVDGTVTITASKTIKTTGPKQQNTLAFEKQKNQLRHKMDHLSPYR